MRKGMLISTLQCYIIQEEQKRKKKKEKKNVCTTGLKIFNFKMSITFLLNLDGGSDQH